MILEIVKYPDPRLALVCEPVKRITPELRKLAADMIETMYQAEGVGLAAPQIGKNIRMLVMDPGWRDQERNARAIVNPSVELCGETIISENEGCLSVPLGYRAEVPRSSMVRLRGLDLDGNELDEIVEGFPAIVLQHEHDHLDVWWNAVSNTPTIGTLGIISLQELIPIRFAGL